MVSYKCPNCGRIYNYKNDGWYQCMNCRYPLKRAEEVNNVKHPEFNPMLSNNHVIGEIKNSNNFTPKCPTCQSTNIRKMGGVERGTSIYAFGIFSKKINKTFKCQNCGYTW